ncbi:MAG: aminopeptidase [Flavobacteriales bacterium]|nr:aminopeptidase [Flavobacteriales bacterium]|tara:strand:+ start:493 stop:1563 length:1071 start_codon:yes stop_codon:yes gene_type:complete
MFKYIIVLFVLFSTFLIKAQDSLVFSNIITLDVNNVESQGKTGTCWSYATASFLESELIRMGKGQYDLSEMFVARNVYLEKADNFVRRHGKTNFGEGSLSHDLINTIEKYGLVPNEIFNGFVTDSDKHDHSELSKLLEAYLNVVISQKKPSVLWRKGYEAILDVYLGQAPEYFNFQGKEYSPTTFAKYLKLDVNDYINLSSFTYHPFYEWFVLGVPDNWSNGMFFNIPIEEMLDIVKKAINNGFSIAWDTDVSNDEFDSKKGVASVDVEVTQDFRQINFDNYTVTDDHLMHITGLAQGSDGLVYFLVKNSWGDNRGMENYKGYIWVSENYFKLNTISIMLHKDGVSKKVIKKSTPN